MLGKKSYTVLVRKKFYHQRFGKKKNSYTNQITHTTPSPPKTESNSRPIMKIPLHNERSCQSVFQSNKLSISWFLSRRCILRSLGVNARTGLDSPFSSVVSFSNTFAIAGLSLCSLGRSLNRTCGKNRNDPYMTGAINGLSWVKTMRYVGHHCLVSSWSVRPIWKSPSSWFARLVLDTSPEYIDRERSRKTPQKHQYQLPVLILAPVVEKHCRRSYQRRRKKTVRTLTNEDDNGGENFTQKQDSRCFKFHRSYSSSSSLSQVGDFFRS